MIPPADLLHILPSRVQMVEPASGDPFFEPLSLSLESRYTAWSFWTKCSHTCSGGHRSRWRTCLNKSKVCKGEIKQDQFCDLEPCPGTFCFIRYVFLKFVRHGQGFFRIELSSNLFCFIFVVFSV